MPLFRLLKEKYGLQCFVEEGLSFVFASGECVWLKYKFYSFKVILGARANLYQPVESLLSFAVLGLSEQRRTLALARIKVGKMHWHS
jgi:hypothetical protein